MVTANQLTELDFVMETLREVLGAYLALCDPDPEHPYRVCVPFNAGIVNIEVSFEEGNPENPCC